jgi:hypothetical protein
MMKMKKRNWNLKKKYYHIDEWEEQWEKMKYDNRVPDMPDSILFVDLSESESEEEEELVVNRKRKRCSWIDDECGVAK